jgi:hypothetical protein
LRLLFDHNVDRRFRRHLIGHAIQTAREMRWEALRNGELLKAAAADGFDAILCIDKNVEYQQNLQLLPLPIIVLDAQSNALHDLMPFAPYLLKLLNAQLSKALYFIEKNGDVSQVLTPRPKS